MNFPYTITFKSGKKETVWIDAENQTDADEYSLNYWSNPEVVEIGHFVEPVIDEYDEMDVAEAEAQSQMIEHNLPDDECNTR